MLWLKKKLKNSPASLLYAPEITAQFDSLLHKVKHAEYIIQSTVNILATNSPIKDDQDQGEIVLSIGDEGKINVESSFQGTTVCIRFKI